MRKRRVDGFVLASLDLFMALVVTFMAMAVLAIIAADKHPQAGVKQGQVFIQMRWQKSANADIDLWVKAPGDQSVGYAHMSDAHCNLLRDDLGRYLDPESRNEEIVVCRGIDPGEWIVDAMLYRSYDGQLPVKVSVTVQSGHLLTQILKRTLELQTQGQQITLFRWRMDAKGHYESGSENFLQMPLYHAAGAAQ